MHKDQKIAGSLVLVVACMVGMSYAAVPLYDLFCRVTGIGGTTQYADILPDQVVDRDIKIRFNADISRELDWAFHPEQLEVTVKVGEGGIAYYRAVNRSDQPITGMATYNVTPFKAGPYFTKIECFCFINQTLQPGEAMDMPVAFFVNPEIMRDSNLDDVGTITLSYTFYKSEDQGVSQAEQPVAPTN